MKELIAVLLIAGFIFTGCSSKKSTLDDSDQISC